MAAIGFVNGTIEKGFVGQLKTLSIRAGIEIRTNLSKNGDVQPDYRVYSDDVEIIDTNVYIWSLGSSKLDSSRDWDYGMFLRKHLDWYLETTVKPCRIAMEKEIS